MLLRQGVTMKPGHLEKGREVALRTLEQLDDLRAKLPTTNLPVLNQQPLQDAKLIESQQSSRARAKTCCSAERSKPAETMASHLVKEFSASRKPKNTRHHRSCQGIQKGDSKSGP